jgi:hypothetical protein
MLVLTRLKRNRALFSTAASVANVVCSILYWSKHVMRRSSINYTVVFNTDIHHTTDLKHYDMDRSHPYIAHLSHKSTCVAVERKIQQTNAKSQLYLVVVRRTFQFHVGVKGNHRSQTL